MDIFGLFSGVTLLNVVITIIIILTVYYMKPIVFKKFPDIPGPAPWPVVGNFHELIKKGAGTVDIECMQKYGKVYRLFEGRNETLVVGDVSILKQILVKDFSNFRNHRINRLRGIVAKSLFDAADQDWIRLRHLLTPSFTSGKLKRMIPLVQKCCGNLLENLDEKAKSKEPVEMKRITGAYAMDVIASTAFGLNLNSLKDVNHPFLVHSLKLSNFSVFKPLFMIIFFAPFMVPPLELIGCQLTDTDIHNFYRDFLSRTIKERQQQRQKQVDLLQLMLDAENEELDQEGRADLEGVGSISETDKGKGLSSDEILAQCMFFFFAAYDTTSTTMSFLMYNLAQYPAEQEQLYQEVMDVMKDYDEANYEAISKMTFMEQCIQETLRMYPAAGRLERRTTKDVAMGGLYIPTDTLIFVPIYAMQHDPEVFPEPDKFKPERFTSDAKATRSPFYHLPFGVGPRQCIGMRLALMEIKLAFVKLVQKYRFLPSQKKLKLGYGFGVRSDEVWIEVEMR